jgi:hypothetical protein
MFLDLDDKIIFYFDSAITPLARDKDVRGGSRNSASTNGSKLYTKKTSTRTKKATPNAECIQYFYSDDADGRYREIETPDETAEDRPLREKPDQGLHDPQPRHDLQLQVAPPTSGVLLYIIL